MLSNSKRIMNNFRRELNGFFTNNIYYSDCVSLCTETRDWDVLEKANLVGKNVCQGKIDSETGGIFYGLFPALKINIVQL